LFVATRQADSPVFKKLLAFQTQTGEIGWRYANYRKVPGRTAFFVPPDATEVHARKSALRPGETIAPVLEGQRVRLKWHELKGGPVATGEENRVRLARRAYFEGPEKCFELLGDFIRWSFARWEARTEPATLAGLAVD